MRRDPWQDELLHRAFVLASQTAPSLVLASREAREVAAVVRWRFPQRIAGPVLDEALAAVLAELRQAAGGLVG
jgi:hypothetical protein